MERFERHPEQDMFAQCTASFQPQQADPTPEYQCIYCIKLPGFDCHTQALPQQSQWQTSATRFADHWLVQSAALPTIPGASASGSDNDYTMIKVGISTNPANRLYNIMSGFKGFGVPAEKTQFKLIDASDSPDDTVENGRKEDNVIFIQKCCSLGDAERKIRCLIQGHIEDLGIPFQDRFKERLGRNGQSYVDRVGMTEWILASTDLVTHIQRNYWRNWPETKLFDPLSAFNPYQTGEQFYKQIFDILVTYNFNLGQAQLQEEAHNVTVNFQPTGFSYEVNINPPSKIIPRWGTNYY